MLRAGISGLGQVGLLFDEDKKRRGIWTHFSAYERLSEEFNLVAACEPDPAKRRKALKRRPQLQVYPSLEAMLDNERLDVLSICTPPALHTQQILMAAGRVRGIICEKPFGSNIGACQKALSRCRDHRTRLAVNYYKRFEGTVQYAHQQFIGGGRLGPYSFAQGIYSGPLEAVGSHALDLLRFLIGPLKLVKAWKRPGLEDSYSATLEGPGGFPVFLAGAGPRHKLVFELDLIGQKGRCRIFDNCSKLELSAFKTSSRYADYDELVPASAARRIKEERFLPLFKEMALALRGRRVTFTSDGESALNTQQLLTQIQRN